MKLLQVSHYFDSHRGGVEIVAGRLYRELAKAGQPMVWMAADTTAPPEPAAESRPVVFRAWNGIENAIGVPCPIPTLPALVKIGSGVKAADVLILHDCLYLSNIAAFLLARRLRKGIILVQHIGLVPYRNRVLAFLMRAGNRMIARRMLGAADQVIFISETTRSFFRDVRLRRPAKVVFNGVDCEVFAPPPTARAKSEIRAQLGLPLDRKLPLFVGRFVEKKGMRVMRRMVSARKDMDWVFAGWGPMNPASWGCANVHVFSDLAGSSIAELYRACDALVLPSTGEGFPLVIQEALASGTPVICSEETGTADGSLQDVVRTVPVYPGDEDRTSHEFLAALDDLFGSTGDPSAESQRCREFAVARYSWPKAAEKYLTTAAQIMPEPAQRESVVESGFRGVLDERQTQR